MRKASILKPGSLKFELSAKRREDDEMSVEDHRSKAPKSVSFAVMTVSDTRTEKDDISGKAIVQLMERAGHRYVRKSIVKDDIPEIQKALRESIEDPRTQAVVINGGTGVAPRDVTLEAVSHFEEKPLPGFGELFRALSFQEIGSAAMMSRATAFVSEGKVVFCLPGSEKAVRLATEKLIAPEIGHLVWEANR
jgi:molybdenum cofactor biosynthesis protein B